MITLENDRLWLQDHDMHSYEDNTSLLTTKTHMSNELELIRKKTTA